MKIQLKDPPKDPFWKIEDPSCIGASTVVGNQNVKLIFLKNILLLGQKRTGTFQNLY